jgi:tRNA (guanine-N(7)-)-methyltransferase subunit TRM82
MPKRPCAVTLTSDGNTILCGDKFGDVYALPLIPSDKPIAPPKISKQAKSYQPSATPLTVHSKRNLAALEQQLRHPPQKTEDKPAPTFERNLLLGHVSLLTDLAFVSLPSSASSKGSQDYILTADRDEHIRVSRGPPQTHIIENYCLGHSSFISKICIPQSLPELLISGGGDDYLLVWNWREGRILQKVPLRESPSKEEPAVRGIWAVSLVNHSNAERQVMAFVALEG